MHDMPAIAELNEKRINAAWPDRETYPHAVVVFDGLNVREVHPADDRLAAALIAASVRARQEAGVYAEVR